MIAGLRLSGKTAFGALCILYASCPYHLFNGYSGPLLDRRSVLASVGLLAGCLVHRALAERRGALGCSGSRVSNAMGFAVLLLALGSIGLELADYPAYLFGDVESASMAFSIPVLTPLVSYYVLRIEPLVVFAGACLSMAAFLLSQEAVIEVHPEKGECVSQIPNYLFGLCLAVCFLLGFSSRQIWSMFQVPAIDSHVPPAVIILAGVFALVVSAALSYSAFKIESSLSDRLREMMSSRQRARRRYISGLILCVCTGQLLCMILARYVYIRPLGILLACVSCAIAAAASLHIASKIHDGISQDEDACDSALALQQILREGYGLSPREALFAVGVLLGKTHSEIASEYEVKPGTVRSTLYRVYRKLGVHGEKELGATLRQHDAIADLLGEREPSGRANVSGAISPVVWGGWRAVADSATTVLMGYVYLSVLLPPGIADRMWGAVRPPLMGVALSLILLGLLGVCSSAICQLDVGDFENGGFELGEKLKTSLSLVLPAALLVSLGFCIHYIEKGCSDAFAGAGCGVAAVIAFGVVSLGAFQFLGRLLARWNNMSIFQISCSVVLWAVGFRIEDKAIVFLAACLALFLRLIVVLRTGDAWHAVVRDSAEYPSVATPHIVILAILFSICFEEWWRSLGQDSLGPASLALFASSTIACYAANHGSFRRTILLRGASVCILYFMVSALTSRLVVGAYPCALLLLLSTVEGLSFRHSAGMACYVAGFSIVCGEIVMNKVQDLALEPPLLVTALFGVGDNLFVVVGTVLVLSCLLCGASLYRLVRIDREERAASLYDSEVRADEARGRRQKALLIARGLSDLQAEILLYAARGYSDGRVSDQLCYAPATIKSLRLASYRQLQIHGRVELVALLSQVDSV